MNNIVVIGAVHSTEACLNKLVEHGFKVTLVLGQRPADVSRVSGLADMQPFCENHEIPFKAFQKINSPENIQTIKAAEPDLIFAVGFSQLIGNEILSVPLKGTIGFHPTLLPRGRGRAPIAWLILRQENGAANFFLMGEGPDEGPVFIQKPFEVTSDDYAADVEARITEAIYEALDEWLPRLKVGEWDPKPQDHSKATWYGKRAPEDGLINWESSAEQIHRLIRASAQPHPGAYTYFGKLKMIIQKARIDKGSRHYGVPGRVLQRDASMLLVACGEQNIWLQEYAFFDDAGNHYEVRLPSVGKKLGYSVEDELFKMVNQENHE